MPPKKNKIDKELKKKNTEAAKSIVDMLTQKANNVEDVISTVDINSLGSTIDSKVIGNSKGAAIDLTGVSTCKDNPLKDGITAKPIKGTATEKDNKAMKRPYRKIASSSKISKKEEPSTTRERNVNKNSVAKGISSAAKIFHYEIDCQRVEDSVDVIKLQQYLTEQLKVGGKKNNLGDNVKVCCEGQKVTINSKVYLPKRSLRFMSKKFLKKAWNIQVISKNKNSYELKYVGTS